MAEEPKSEGTPSVTAASLLEEELSVLIGDYSIPHMAELSPESLLTKSQYAKVIFHDIADTYLTDADICCRYSLTDGVTPQHGDRIALYRVGWSSVQEYILFEWAPGPPVIDNSELQVLFKASSLPKDVQEFYQLCYVTADNTVCGASVPFQFRHPYENELCAIEEPGGLVVVRSRSSLTEEKLRKSIATTEQLQREKLQLDKSLEELREAYRRVSTDLVKALENISKLVSEKQALEKRVEDNLHVERHVERLKQDLLALDAEKNQSLAKLHKAEQHITVLTTTVDTLSADKEHMAMLLRSETQNKSGVVAEVTQYKGQVDSLTHMLEALTQSKEMVAQELRIQQATCNQLAEDVGRLERETAEQQKRISALEDEKKLLQELLEQSLKTEKSVEEKDIKINELEKEKERLLSELVQSVSTREENLKERTRLYEEEIKAATDRLIVLEKQLDNCKIRIDEKAKDTKETEQINMCLTQQLKDCKKEIVDREREIFLLREEKTTLQEQYIKMTEENKKMEEHNERLTIRLLELESESVPLRLQLQESNLSHERQQNFRDVFNDLENRITNLEIEQEDIASHKNLQMERTELIKQRLSELDVEVAKLQCERQDVAIIRDTQNDELTQKVAQLADMEDQYNKSHVMEFISWSMVDESVLASLKEAVGELTCFVESSKMRITEIDQRLLELEDEKLVLQQQQDTAWERKEKWEIRESDIRKEIAELQEREREIVKEQGGQLALLQDQLDQALTHNSEMLANGLSQEEELAMARKEKVELEQKQQGNKTAPQDQESINSCLEQEQELKLRLQLAAAEYRKLYTEKQRVEKRLTKLYHKLGERKLKSAASAQQSDPAREQPATAELISLSQSSGVGTDSNNVRPSQPSGSASPNTTCPICHAMFPPGASDLFGQHFEAHLS